MYCSNCGNKVDDKAYICVNCGVILKKKSSDDNFNISKKNKNISGIISIVISIMAVLFSLNGFLFGDITSVGMYTNLYERFFFAMGYNLIPMVLMIIAFILSLINIKKNYNKIGLGISFAALFLIITEFIVILIY